MSYLRFFIIIFLSFIFTICNGQTLGGSTAYQFLKLSPSAVLTAAGGINTSLVSNEAGMAFNQPAMLNKDLHSQLHLSFNSFLGGINAYTTGGILHQNKLNTTFGVQVFFVDYGSVPQADAAGNIGGQFKPVDFAVQFSAGRKYGELWNYGASLRFISSTYPPYSSKALAVDVGVLYNDSVNNFSASFLAKNMGFALTAYGATKEELPFELHAGISKRLNGAPFGFSFTAQNIQRFNLHYNDTTFNNENEVRNNATFLNKLFDHFVIATHIYLGQHLEATIGYNHLRRRELTSPQGGNGLTGFSTGLRLKFQKLEVQYARSTYQRGVSLNQLGLVLKMNKLISGL
jgi:hypothetical protein